MKRFGDTDTSSFNVSSWRNRSFIASFSASSFKLTNMGHCNPLNSKICEVKQAFLSVPEELMARVEDSNIRLTWFFDEDCNCGEGKSVKWYGTLNLFRISIGRFHFWGSIISSIAK